MNEQARETIDGHEAMLGFPIPTARMVVDRSEAFPERAEDNDTGPRE